MSDKQKRQKELQDAYDKGYKAGVKEGINLERVAAQYVRANDRN